MNILSIASQMKAAFKGNTGVLVRCDSYAVEVYYHDTCICKVKPDGEIVLDNGGFYTKTTKQHLNTCLLMLGKSLSIYQKKSEWFFSDHQAFHRHFRMTTY